MFKLLSKAFLIQNLMAKFIALIPPAVGHNLGKYFALYKAFYLTSLDGVEGDYLEFGVFTGSSFQSAIEFSKRPIVGRKTAMKFFGFDSFKGFGDLSKTKEDHPFFKDLNFETDAAAVENRLARLAPNPKQVHIIPGFFEESLKGKTPDSYGIGKASVILLDCDTYSASALAFDFFSSTLQEGTMILVDDFFSYKGSSKLGTYGAFLEFEKKNPEWKFRHVCDYGHGGVLLIATK